MKALPRSLLVMTLVPAAAMAQEEPPYSISANAAIATEYIFRGISQTDESAAIQGGFDGSYSLQAVDLYAGVWASNVDFNDDDEAQEAQTEFDFYGGFTGKLPLGEGMTWNAGVIYFMYPGADTERDYDFIEGYLGLGYAFSQVALTPEVGIKVSYTPDYFLESGDGIYVDGTGTLSLPYDLGLGFHYGYQSIEDEDVFGAPSYSDWSVSLSKEVLSLDLSIAYVDTDLSKDECGGTSLCDARAVFTVSKSF
ncbi:MAG: TorF family putative porin [Gammaproteobacteria bacterium]